MLLDPSFLQDSFSEGLLFLALTIDDCCSGSHPYVCVFVNVQCFERMDKFLAEQNTYFEDYGLEFVPPLANGLLHFDVIVHPVADKKRVEPSGTLATTSSSAVDSNASEHMI